MKERKVLSLVLAIVLLTSSLGVNVFAVDNTNFVKVHVKNADRVWIIYDEDNYDLDSVPLVNAEELEKQGQHFNTEDEKEYRVEDIEAIAVKKGTKITIYSPASDYAGVEANGTINYWLDVEFVEIYKEFTNDDGDSNQEFEFDVEITTATTTESYDLVFSVNDPTRIPVVEDSQLFEFTERDDPNDGYEYDYMEIYTNKNSSTTTSAVTGTFEVGSNKKPPVKIVVFNKKLYGDITINKDVINDDNTDEFTVEVEGPDGYTTEVAISEGNSVTLTGLELGEYTLTELDAAGYIIDGPYTVTLQEKNDNLSKEVTFENEKIYGSIVINKNVFMNDEDISDSTKFMVTVNGPDGYTTQVAISEGNPVTLTGLELGTYSLTEGDKAGYAEGTVDDVVLTDNDPDAQVTFINERETGKLTINKEVYIDGVLQPNNTEVFEFEVDGQIVEATAVTPGEITLPTGTYTVTETEANMYEPDSVTQQAIVNAEGGEVTFVNRYNTPTEDLVIQKVVYIDGVLQPDNTEEFEFTITGDNLDSPIVVTATAVSQATVNLEEGTYLVTETDANGYTPDNTTMSAVISEEAGDTVVFINRYTTPEYKLIIEKHVIIDGNHDIDNTDVFTFEISGNGIDPVTVTASAVASGEISLPAGTYLVTETGYGKYTPDTLTQQALVGEVKKVTFFNRYTTEDGTLIIDKNVQGNMSKTDDVFNFMIWTAQEQQVTTASATHTANAQISLAPGYYMVQELDPSPYTLLSENWQMVQIFEGESTTATFLNEYQVDPGTLIIDKEVWINGEIQPGNTEEFTFMVDGETVTASALTDGMIELAPGQYTVVETGYGDYTPVTTSQSVTITEGETTTATFINELYEPATLIIEKDVTGNQSNPDDEFIFDIYAEETTEPFITVNASETTAAAVELPAGTYLIEERDPSPYINASPSQVITELFWGQTTTVQFINDYDIPVTDPGHIVIVKTVEGNMADDTDVFTFEITDGQGLVVDTVTASALQSGMTKALMPGQYMVKETVYGNYVPDSVQKSVLVQSKEDATVIFKNVYQIDDGTLVIEKVVAGNQADPDKEFEFEVYEGTTLIDTLYASETTSASINLQPGEYTVKEVNYAPYTSSDDEKTAVISENETTTLTFTNTYNVTQPEKGTITISKDVPNVEADTTEFTITVKDASGATVAQQNITDGNSIVLSDLELGTYTITESANSNYMQDKNSATVTLTSGNKTAAVTFVNTLKEYEMTIDKSVDDNSVYVQDDVTYTITVTNTGNMDLDNVLIEDENLDFSETADIAAGQSVSYDITTSYASAGTYPNTATATDDMAGEVSDDETVVVNRKSNRTYDYTMRIVKTVDKSNVRVGDTVNYTITVTNTGDRPLTNVRVEDDMLGLNEVISVLDTGSANSVRFTESYRTTREGQLINTATATDDQAGTVEDSVTVFVTRTPEGNPDNPDMTIEKVAIKQGVIKGGDTVKFRITVTNTGDVRLENILVKDDLAMFETIIPSLEVGESESFMVDVVVPEGYIGPYENVATATEERVGTVDDADIVFVEEIPLDVPDTGVNPTLYLYGLLMAASGTGLMLRRKKEDDDK